MRLSPVPKVFVSSAKSVCLQHKTRLSLAINAFVCSAISYSEVNSKDYLIAGDKRIHLQCDNAFGDE